MENVIKLVAEVIAGRPKFNESLRVQNASFAMSFVEKFKAEGYDFFTPDFLRAAGVSEQYELSDYMKEKRPPIA